MLKRPIPPIIGCCRNWRTGEGQWPAPDTRHRSLKFVGQPLRSVMPVLCATGRLQMDSGSETVDVPFAFASMLAGIAGFMMLLKDIQGAPPSSEGWSQHIFKRPSHRELHRRFSRLTCVCCSAIACLTS